MSSYLSYDPRAALAGTLDGDAFVRASKIHLQYSAIMGFHSRWFTRLDIALNSPFPMQACVLPAACDDAGALLRMAGLKIRQADLSPDCLATAPVIVAGCSRMLPDYLPADFFERGGVLVSSDRTILDVPHLAGMLECLNPAPAREVPLVVHDARQRLNQCVLLPAGHIPVRLATTRHCRVEIIASDHATGEPIVLAARIENGWLLHSVAHWNQDVIPSGSPARLTGAIRSMSLALLTGLEFVLSDRAK